MELINRRIWTSSVASCGPPGTHHESHIAVEQMEKAYQLPQALARVGRIEEPVQLGHRGAEATRKLASAEPGPLRPPPRLHGQLVNQELGQVARILVVLEGVVDVYGALLARFEDVRDGFAPELLVDVGLPNPILRSRPRVELGIGNGEDLTGAHGELQLCLAVVHQGTADLHSTPSLRSSRSTWTVRRPSIGTRSSRFHFTISFPSHGHDGGCG